MAPLEEDPSIADKTIYLIFMVSRHSYLPNGTYFEGIGKIVKTRTELRPN